MSLRLALIRSLEGIETSNDDDNVKKNEEKIKHRRVKKKTPIVELPKIDKCVRNDDPTKVSVYISCVLISIAM